MADLTWLRLRSGHRPRTSTGRLSSPRSEPSLRPTQGTTEGTGEVLVRQAKSSTRLSIWQSAAREPSNIVPATTEPKGHLVVQDLNTVWHNPSVDQMADALRVAIMSKSVLEALPISYHAHILHVIEAYDSSRANLGKMNDQLRTKDDDLRIQDQEWKKVQEDWMTREAQYKAEIKRLELIIHHTSNKVLEAVTLARTDTLVRKRPQRTSTLPTTCGTREFMSSTSATQDGDEAVARPRPTATYHRSICQAFDEMEIESRLRLGRQREGSETLLRGGLTLSNDLHSTGTNGDFSQGSQKAYNKTGARNEFVAQSQHSRAKMLSSNQ